jgi:hypothetical protein
MKELPFAVVGGGVNREVGRGEKSRVERRLDEKK